MLKFSFKFGCKSEEFPSTGFSVLTDGIEGSALCSKAPPPFLKLLAFDNHVALC